MELNYLLSLVHLIRSRVRFLSYIFILFFISSCVNNFKDKCELNYINSLNKFCVEGEINNGTESNNRFIFNAIDKKSFSEAGFFLNGFRNGKWQYDDTIEVKTIEWAYFIDTAINFETNIFSYVDSIKYEPGLSKLKFSNSFGDVILSVSVNGPLKDSIPVLNYVKITLKELGKMGLVVKKIIPEIVKDSRHTIYIHKFILADLKDTTKEGVIIKNGFCEMSSDLFIEFSVRFEPANSFLGNKLFEGVLTNSWYNRKRLYYPFFKR
jgi:hypothetical protein